MSFRTGLRQLFCLPNINCGDTITAIYTNKLRDLGQSSFEAERMVVSVFAGMIDSAIPNVIGGYCWNMINGFDGNPETLISYRYEPDIRYQDIFPHTHKGMTLYYGSQAPSGVSSPGTYWGTYVDDNGIHGSQIQLGNRFENRGENRVTVRVKYKRGRRYRTSAQITKNISERHILEFNNDNSHPIAYTQHVQIWYCRPNPVVGFPPYKILVFDDSDFALGVMEEKTKTIDISSLTPISGTSEEHYLLLATWFEAPYEIMFSGMPPMPLYNYQHEFVFNTNFNGPDARNPDGLISITANLFKEC